MFNKIKEYINRKNITDLLFYVVLGGSLLYISYSYLSSQISIDQETIKQIGLIGLLVLGIYYLSKQRVFFYADAIDTLKLACSSESFKIKGYFWEKIEKESIYWKEGDGSYLYEFHIPESFIKIYCKITYGLSGSYVTELRTENWDKYELKKLQGRDITLNDIQKALEEKKKKDTLLEE